MEDMTENETTIAWLWIIEAMSSFKEVSLSLIRDLVQAAPELPCGMARNAKERIALRCLEDLCARQSRRTSDDPSSLGSKVEFERSESCENVLQRIVQETPQSDLKTGGPELSKYDILTFIRHKEKHLPKLALEKLRDSILDGSHPYADFLREKAELESTTWDNGVCLNDQNRKSVTSAPNLTRSGVENKRVDLRSESPVFEDKDKQLEGNLQNGDVLPSKRGRSDPKDEDCASELESHDGIGNSDVQNGNRKKVKFHASSDNQASKQNSVPLCEKEPEEGLPETSASSIPNGYDMAGSDGGTMEGRVLEGSYNDDTVLKMSCDRDDDEVHEDGRESSLNADMMQQETTTNEPHVCLSPDGSKGVNENCADPSGIPSTETPHKSPIQEPKSSNEHYIQCQEPNSAAYSGPQEKTIASKDNEVAERREAEISSDSYGYLNERNDVAKKKHDFLGSQHIDSHDSLVADSSEKNLCMKCNEAGQVLVCNSNNCQVVVHEKCFGSSILFDDKGNFHCPFCAYSLAITKYLEAKKESSSARKELSAFIRRGSGECQPVKSTTRSNKQKKHRAGLSKNENFLGKNNKDDQLEGKAEDEGDQVASNVNVENDHRHRNLTVDYQQTELSALCKNNANLECEKGEKGIEDCLSAGESDGPQNGVALKSDNASGENADMDIAKAKEDIGSQPQSVKQKDFLDDPKQLAKEFSIDSSEGDDDDDDTESNIVKYCISVRARETRHKTYPAVPQDRRKYLPWTDEEEQKIQEGVEIFSDERKIPWKKILEFGASVFLDCRTPDDLKGKWRNMCRSLKLKQPV